MRFRIAALPFVVVLVGASLAHAQPNSITTTGTLVSKSPESLVVRIDDGAHRITFAVDRSTVLPDGLAAGRRVSVVYHPTGSTGQTADSVTLLEGGSQKAPRASSKEKVKPGTKGASY